MKAERRHELKTNALAGAITDIPSFFREYGSRLLLAVVFVLLVITLVYQYTTGRVVQNEQGRVALSTGHDAVDRVKQMMDQLAQMPFMVVPVDTIVKFRDDAARDADKAIVAAAAANDPSIKAEAEVLRGDLNMALASFPPLPGSTTRPSLNGDRSHEELLRAAQDSYNRVLASPLNANKEAVRNARFSLAAIAEDRSEWDKARQSYQQILDDPSMDGVFKDMARERQDNLKTLEKPMLVAARTAPMDAPMNLPSGPLGPILPYLPTTIPSGILGAGPTTAPTATTQPATQPATRP